jgi:hypothetical protein
MENQTMSNTSIFITVYTAFNLISLFADIMGNLICFIMLCIIAYRLIRMKFNRGRIVTNVPLILSINVLCIIILKGTIQMIHITIPTLKRDFQLITEFKETPLCQVRAYILWSMAGVLFWSYALLAFFRFVRVIYPTKLWLHRSFLYLYVLIPGQIIFMFMATLPALLIFNGIHLIPHEAYCDIVNQPLYSVVYTSVFIFIFPYTVICIFYVWIGKRIRQSSVIRPYQKRNRIDFIVIHRMLLHSVILSSVTVPYLVIFIYDAIHDHFDSLLNRVRWLSSSISSCFLPFILPLITKQLHDLLMPNRLVPAHN